jgi:arylformamidase
MNKPIDVTVPLSADVTRYPGDPAFEHHFDARLADGAGFNLSRMSLGVHFGTHVEAPLHFLEGGQSVAELPLEILIGKARVVELSCADKIERVDLEAQDLRDDLRVLLKTRMSGQLRQPDFRPDHVYLTADAARYLVHAGIKLIGIDYLSVDAHSSDRYPAHHELLGAGVIVVEGLDLSTVEAGEYELICLPLPVVGAEAAPARVILRPRP